MRAFSLSIRYLALTAVGVVMVGPLVWMIRVGLSPAGSSLAPNELAQAPWTFGNVVDLFSRYDILRALWNSTLVAALVTIGNVVFCLMSGYALARKRFIGSRLVFVSLLVTLMVPAHALIIPLFLMMTKVGLFDNLAALVLPFLVTPLGVFMIRQYVAAIPPDIEDAARIDGAGEWRVLFRVVGPLCRPILATLAIQTFLTNWNAFLYPFILTNSADLRTLPVALANLQGYQSIDWQRLMAGSTVAVIPILIVFVIFQRQIVAGVTAGAVKQ